MRISAGALDIDRFRAFVLSRGATLERARPAAGEVLRFRIDLARGIVALRKNGTFTLITMAVDLYREFKGHPHAQ